ncbi:hypothetical protein TNCV_332221 [Trichonephila clavipes]|nr:hypothetical protein TNCV_332221 [Trichonephila clavipes]
MRADMTVKVFGESSDSFVQRLNICVFVEVDSYYVGAASLGDDCGVVCEEADMNCWCGGEVVREDII